MKNNISDDNISYFFGFSSKSKGEESVIYAYGKGYTSIIELENEQKLISKNVELTTDI